MEIQVAFQVLGIEKTKDETQIRDAYRKLLSTTNPEDDQEGFKRLREAYEVALEYSRSQDEEEEKRQPVTDVDFFMEKFENQYLDLRIRFDEEGWKELLSDPVCDGLDTSMEVRDRVIAFLMDNVYITHEIWKALDNKFDLVEDMENLKEQYPANFLEYVRRHVTAPDIFPYHLFVYATDDVEVTNPDVYLDTLTQIKGEIDSLEGLSNEDESQAEEKRNGFISCRQKLEDLKAFGVYHPFYDAEQLRIACNIGDPQEIEAFCDKLKEYTSEVTYIGNLVGEAYWVLEDIEKAYELWTGVLEKDPDYYRALYNVACYHMKKEDYKEARKVMEKLLNLYDQDDRVINMLRKANDAMIIDFQNKIAAGEDDEDFPGYEKYLELGWCFLQNERADEGIKLLEANEPTEEEYIFGYTNLLGRMLYQQMEYERACPYIERWKEMLLNMEDDGTEKTKNRLARKNVACGILGGIYFELDEREKAVENVELAIEFSNDIRDRLDAMRQLANMRLKWEEYEKVVDVCEQILNEDDGYYPAVLMHQEACYELDKAQEVVDDYHHAVSIYPNYFKPYLLATQIFFYYNQYEDGLNTIKRAEENGVELSPKMLLFKVKILRNLAESKADRAEIFGILDTIEDMCEVKNPQSDFWDLEDESEIPFERGVLYWDNNNLDQAHKFIKKASKKNPERGQYNLVLGNLFVERKWYKEALQEYDKAAIQYKNSPEIYYRYAVCYEKLKQKDKAIENFEKVLELRNTYYDTCERLGNYYFRKYERTYEREYLEKAIEVGTRQVEANPHCYHYVTRGLYYMDSFDIENAIADFEEALKYDEDDWAAWNNLGCCYKYLDEFEKAIEHFERSLACLEKTGQKEILPYDNMAKCYEILGQYEKAIECYRLNLEKMNPHRISVYEKIGTLQEYLGQFEEARKSYGMLSDTDAYKNIAYTYLREGKVEECIKKYKELIKVASETTGFDKCDIYNSLGMIYVDELGEYEKGIKYLQRAVVFVMDEEDKYDTYRNLAKAYFLSKDKRRAKNYAEKALKHFAKSGQGTREDYLDYKPYLPARLGNFGWMELCLGNTEKAMELFEEMGNNLRCRRCTDRKCFESVLYLGDCYAAMGEIEKAKEFYEKTLSIFPGCEEARLKLERLKNPMKGKLGLLSKLLPPKK